MKVLGLLGASALCAALRPAPLALRLPSLALPSSPSPDGPEDWDPENPVLITGDEADAFVAMLDDVAQSGGAELLTEDDAPAQAEAPPKKKRRW